jgi:hypothetical protein
MLVIRNPTTRPTLVRDISEVNIFPKVKFEALGVMMEEKRKRHTMVE